jgi:hypothetical protein
MITFGLRLTFRGGREAAARLAITAVAVALGAGLLLITLAGVNAVQTQNARYAWLNTMPESSASSGSTSSAPATDPLWWLIRADYFDGQTIGLIDVAPTGPSSPVPPGITRLPGPGQYYASPALSKLLRTAPAGQLGDRFSGHQIGTVGPAALPAPNSLIIIVGHSPGQLSREPGAQKITSIATAVPGVGYIVGNDANGLDLILSVVALALLFPVLIFIGTTTRLSAARREQRFAAMRLVGATPRQVSVVSAVESTIAAVVGVAAGFGLFFLLRAPMAAIPFTGAPFFTSDLSLSLSDIAAIAIGVPAAAAVAARLALRRVRISPLGVSRRVTPAAPRAWRVIPLLAGISWLVLFVIIGRLKTTHGQIAEYLPGFFLIMAGLIISGPWLTMAGARVMARRTSRPATLIAGRRLADSPRAGFRAISGLILALFVSAVAVGVITTMDVYRGPDTAGAAGRDTLVGQFVNRFASQQFSGQTGSGAVAPIPGVLLAQLRSVGGVRGVTVIHAPVPGIGLPAANVGDGVSEPAGLASCAELTRTPALGRCPSGAVAAQVPSQVFAGFFFKSQREGRGEAATVWPAAAVSAQRLEALPVQAIVVGTNGSAATTNRARTILETAYPYHPLPQTISETGSDKTLEGEQQLANVVILVSLPIAGCTLAVSVIAGLSDRKRPFAMLRLTGVPLGMLRRVVVLESVVPLLLVALLSVVMGFLAAQLFVTSELHYTLKLPGSGFYGLVAGGLAVSLGIIASTFPLLNRITGPETARNE